MEFINRETQFPDRKKLIKVDANNIPIGGEEPILVRMEKDEGVIYADGTPISPENLNKGNWRDDEGISFMSMSNDAVPAALDGETQIVTKSNGETWIVPPAGLGTPKEITDPNGSVIRINGVKGNVEFISDPQAQITSIKNNADSARSVATVAQNTADAKSVVKVNNVKSNVNFTSDPQIQITAVKNTADAARDAASVAQTTANGKSTVNVNGAKADISFTGNPQTQIDAKSTVKVNNIRSDVNFTSDPQVQIDAKAPLTALDRKADNDRLNGLKRWKNIYENLATGFIMEGDTANFGDATTIADGTVFRLTIWDIRTNILQMVNAVFYFKREKRTEVFFQSSYDTPTYKTGTPWLVKTLFNINGTKVNMASYGSPISSEGNTNWRFLSNDAHYIVRIDKEVNV